MSGVVDDVDDQRRDRVRAHEVGVCEKQAPERGV